MASSGNAEIARQVHIYQPGAAPRVESQNRVAGSRPVEDFALDLKEIWRCFE